MATQLDSLFRMEIHAPKAYDLSATVANAKKSSRSTKTDEELFKILDKIPNV
jgi:hypothetical protein